jgi:FKBP-type peptidyl-prolyl cis-trans isomerase 2
LRVDKVAGDIVETRLVHPLAEKDLAYKFEVMQVTDPRPPPVPVAALKLQESDDANESSES